MKGLDCLYYELLRRHFFNMKLGFTLHVTIAMCLNVHLSFLSYLSIVSLWEEVPLAAFSGTPEQQWKQNSVSEDKRVRVCERVPAFKQKEV